MGITSDSSNLASLLGLRPPTKVQMELNRVILMIRYHDTWDPLLDTLRRDSAQVCTNCWSMNWETAMEDMMRDGSTAENRAEGRAPTCFLLHSFSQQCSREGDARESDNNICSRNWLTTRTCFMRAALGLCLGFP